MTESTRQPVLVRQDGSPIRALVVDDESSLADLLTMALRYEGWSVKSALLGHDALSLARDFRPDIIVLDIMLPDIDGLEVLRRLRADGFDGPVLFLTAKDAVRDRIAGLTASGDDYVTKPFSLEELVARLRGLLRRSGHTLPPDITKSMARIESESIRMTALVEELLLLARLDEGTELVLQPVDLTALVQDAVDDARASSPDHTWKFTSSGGDAAVTGDPSRLHQAVANLLTNARVHTPQGTTVTTDIHVADGRIAVVVGDDGPGVAKDVIPNLFERFVRGDSSRSRGAGSTGLGLAITKAIVDAHGGSISVTSIPGDTTFTMELESAAPGTTGSSAPAPGCRPAPVHCVCSSPSQGKRMPPWTPH